MNKLKARIDAFNRLIVDAKAANVWDSIEAACIMAGWSNVAGALTPLKGAAPTNNGFIDSDLDAGIGLKGDGSSYVNSNRANNADGQDDQHACVLSSTAFDGTEYVLGSGVATSGTTNLINIGETLYSRSRSSSDVSQANAAVRFIGVSRSASDSISLRGNSQIFTKTLASQTPNTGNIHVYGTSGTSSARSDATLAWYSIGSSVDLAALDTVVSQLAADLRAIDEDGFDPLATDYIRRVEAADGAYLETGVKQAINAFVVGCRKDGTLDALKASCILCGARTISGALVPLVGDAPTPYNFTASDYDRSTGLKGDGSTTYLDSNRANDADGQNDQHMAVYVDTPQSSGFGVYIGASDPNAAGASHLGRNQSVPQLFARCQSAAADAFGDNSQQRLFGISRALGGEYTARFAGTSLVLSRASQVPSSDNVGVFFRIGASTGYTDARLAFYSIGSSLDLAALDARVTNLISSIATALS